MKSLHEAGDALVAMALMEGEGLVVLGSGVMIGPGLVVAATHVLEEFAARNARPVLLTFLPNGTRAWLPRDARAVSRPSAFEEDRQVVSDVSLLSCTLNSEAHLHCPLMLAPLQIGLPLIGERLWAFGYRHGGLEDATALIVPLVSSGVVTAAFPQGRGERMPSACIEVDMDTKGGMSGGPVVNANGDLVGIVSSSFDGGPSYVTLIWDALRLRVSNSLPSQARRSEIDLFAAQALGLVKLKGQVKRSKRGNITMTLSSREVELMAVSSDPAATLAPPAGSKFLADAELEDFEECWLPIVETKAGEAAMAFLEALALPSVHGFLVASDVPASCVAPILAFSVKDFEGVEDPDIQSARADVDGGVLITLAFDLLSVIWTVEVPTSDYLLLAADYDAHFLNVVVSGPTARMELFQRCHFEAALILDQKAAKFTLASIAFAGVIRRRSHASDLRSASTRGAG